MKRILSTLAICVAVGIAILATAHETQWPAKKLDALIPGAKFTPRKYKLTSEQVKAVEASFSREDPNGNLSKEDKEGTVYIGVGKDPKTGKTTTLGVVLFMDPKGPHGVMEAGIAVDPKGKLLNVRVFEHKEGKALNDAALLKKLVGKTVKDLSHGEHDHETADADERAIQAVISSAKRMMLVLDFAFAKPKPDSISQKEKSGAS